MESPCNCQTFRYFRLPVARGDVSVSLSYYRYWQWQVVIKWNYRPTQVNQAWHNGTALHNRVGTPMCLGLSQTQNRPRSAHSRNIHRAYTLIAVCMPATLPIEQHCWSLSLLADNGLCLSSSVFLSIVRYIGAQVNFILIHPDCVTALKCPLLLLLPTYVDALRCLY